MLPDILQLSCAFSVQRMGNGNPVITILYYSARCNHIKEAHTWCLFSISRPSSMSIGWSSKMEKEQGRKSPSIWT